MPRLQPAQAVELYHSSEQPTELLIYDHDEHAECMRDLTTGLVGALLKLKLRSLSGPEIGSSLPLVALYVPGDLIRILIDPEVETYGASYDVDLPYIQKAQEHCLLTALSYRGEELYFDTGDMPYTNALELAAELQNQCALLSRFPRGRRSA